jgi:tRNA 2-thiouridine synthesizing protein A
MHVLDVRHKSCPLPVLETKKALRPLGTGESIKVMSTDPGSVSDLDAFCSLAGHHLYERSEDEGEFTFLIRKG